MPYRFIPFVDGQYYHIYNRGSEKRSIFEARRDYQRFLKTVKYYQIEGPKPKFSHFPNLTVNRLDETKKIIEIVAYCLMPNHFHFLIKQSREGGITEFIRKVSNSYAKYYNTKYSRVGPLLQGTFKAVLIETDEQLLHVSRYIHLNPISSFLVKELNQYKWSSYEEYTTKSSTNLCSKEEILGFFKNLKDYQQFILDQIDYAQKIEIIKHQLIDED
ncbi:MAG: transposase [Candidatus Daviesbacteria bacterium]